ncbi:MAG TPA: nitrite reductase large subunit NirB, partial [Nocardioidaceae bacterium]|nr:nitrite reductase large subunit NirB [Nocardioidaceae bacterium]
MTHLRQTLVVAGNGMVGHRFVQAAIERGLTERFDIVVVGEEPRPAYDRVALTSFFSAAGADELSLLPDGAYDDPRVRLLLGTTVSQVDRTDRRVALDNGEMLAYDVLVLATGAAPFVPPVPGHDLDGCFVYRTIEDLEAIRDAAVTATSGAVIGGGLLGLEAANALVQLGLETHVVEMAPRLMPVQLDEAGGTTLVRHIEKLGVHVHTGAATRRVVEANGRAAGLELGEETVDAQVVVFSAGIRPRDQLARDCGLLVAERGGVLVDEQCRTEDPHVFAIGECAAPGGTMYGLVAPGYSMAEVVVDTLLDGEGAFTGADMSTKLKLLGVDVASYGDAFATTPGALELVLADAVAGVYKKLVISEDGTRLLGGILVGDASAYGTLRPMVSSGIALPENPEELILPVASARSGAPAVGMPDEAVVCSCNNVDKATICAAVDAGSCDTVACLKKCTRAGSTCGSCVPVVKSLLDERLAVSGVAVATGICEHFDLSRQELFDVIAVHGYRTFDDIVTAHGRGRGCDVCKPAVASILASQLNGHVLDKSTVALQDTNDAYLANIQR